MNGSMKQDRFIDLFCDSHHSIGCKQPCCNNAHRMNMGIVRNLYTQEKDMLDRYISIRIRSQRKTFTSLSIIT